MTKRWRLRALAITLTLGAPAVWGAGSGFWMPYSATPATAAGKSGLFLISSNAVGASPAPTPGWVTTAEPTVLGPALQGFPGGTTPPTTVTPALMIYAAQGADGSQHLYGLDLANPTNSTSLPKPVQITNLSVPASQAICSVGQFETNATAPKTLSVVIHVATPEAGAKPGTSLPD